MGIVLLDSDAFTSTPSNYTPPTDANFFAFHLGTTQSGGGSSDWDSVTWDGASDPAQDGVSAVNAHATQSNTAHAAIWYLTLPDVSGQGSISWNHPDTGDGDLHISAWKIVHPGDPLLGTATDIQQSGDSTASLSADPNAWVPGALTVGVVQSTSGSSTSITNELHETSLTSSGYRLSDGAISASTSGTTKEAALAVATFSPVPLVKGVIAVM